jgi:hypothetical protein
VQACYRPEGIVDGRRGVQAGYSAYARPVLLEGPRGVAVDERLGDIEPLALAFVPDSARDNGLRVSGAADGRAPEAAKKQRARSLRDPRPVPGAQLPGSLRSWP